ncbi:hypothetical protein RHSIM_Rhsim12G0179800 [Rhododendron simsii]|uniref:Uncharacterized protein n=1 Tax=Rhododendron simsii TaxID=118357 RepID=A0A834G3A5_RHOSS|nr:hypothetical protein RHSIM_Rhsim12G0179800 [Rhododendron simsii]
MAMNDRMSETAYEGIWHPGGNLEELTLANSIGVILIMIAIALFHSVRIHSHAAFCSSAGGAICVMEVIFLLNSGSVAFWQDLFSHLKQFAVTLNILFAPSKAAS